MNTDTFRIGILISCANEDDMRRFRTIGVLPLGYYICDLVDEMLLLLSDDVYHAIKMGICWW